MKKYPVAKPYITAEDKAGVLAVLNSDQLSLGPVYKKFEKKFAKKIGVKYACAVSSGTAGLHLVLLACGIKAGDEVITTPFSFVASANSILYVGAKPVFVDIDPLTYNMDPLKIEAKITKKTKAILAVHIFGQPSEMDPIRRIAKKYKLQIIEDACESIGATYKAKQAGTFGQAGVFAFYPNKQMTTGEGGMIVTNDKKIYEICDSLRNQGRANNDQWLDHKYLGYNYRLDEMSSALGVSQLAKLDFMISERRKIAAWYGNILKPLSNIIQAPVTAANNTHTWFVYVVKIKNKKINRDLLMKNLKKAGVSTKLYLPSIHLFDFYKKMFGYKKGDFPIAEAVSSSSLALPIYIGLTKKDCELIINALASQIDKLNKVK
ncbi:MAG: DegT/DnrJ/EryC1/StrS family aminotransferase [Patescibacteria group bacterium]|nr:DegT/DnrJ/EryC1/StrS family aminotransferase [Patescibacteria group bacterium]